MSQSQSLCKLTVIAAILFCCANLFIPTVARADTYTQGFDFPDGTTDLGDGTTIGSTTGVSQVIGGALRLTDTVVGSERASFRIPALPESSLGWTANFDLTLVDAVGGNPPADGFTFSYGAIPPLTANDPTANGHGGAEGGFSSGNEISFQIDTWQNGNANSPGVGVLQNSVLLPNGRLDGTVVQTDGSVSGAVSIVFTPLAVDFTTSGLETNAAFSELTHTFAGSDDFSWAFSARTGGATEDVFIDNLVITTGSPDSDGDGLPDSWEIFFDLDPDDNGEDPNNNGVPGDPDQGADGDPDMDTLTNAQEFARATFPNSDDTDMDGLKDNVEDGGGVYVSASMTGTNPTVADSDDDLYSDMVETNAGSYTDEDDTGTDPNNPDSDGDGLPDGSEVGVGRDPTVADAPGPSLSYLQDFTGYPNGAKVLGDGSTIGSSDGIAQVLDGALRITSTATGNTRASFRIPPLVGSSTGWTATFDLTLTDAPGGNPPADGFSFNYGAIPDLVGSGPEATGNGGAEGGHGSGNEISFVVDTWENGNAANPSGFAILQNGGALPDGRVDGEILPNDASLTVPVMIEWNPTDATFITTGLSTDAAFENFPHTFVGDDSFSWVFSARTGGATQDLIIDNLEIRIGTGTEGFRILSIDKVVVPGEGGDPDTISVTVTWASEEGNTYGVYASPDMPMTLIDWLELDDSVPGETGVAETSYTETGIPIDTERRFYQIRDTSQ